MPFRVSNRFLLHTSALVMSQPAGWQMRCSSKAPEGKLDMFLALFFVLFIIWLVAWAALHVTGGLIHLLLVLAVVSIIAHFFRGRTAV